MATITLQNYFRMYNKLAGMTGTAATEAAEFNSTYNLGVVPIPTNKPSRRDDEADLIYRTEEAKFAAVVDDIVERNEAGQPVLVGTVSVEKSELLSGLLRAGRLARGAERQVPRPGGGHRRRGGPAQLGHRCHQHGRSRYRHHARRQSGFRAAAELAARGLNPTDDPDGYEAAWPDALAKAEETVAAEHDEVTDLGGLYVLGTERHESRRIDNQLRGRSGRQGDRARPGSTSRSRTNSCCASTPAWSMRSSPASTSPTTCRSRPRWSAAPSPARSRRWRRRTPKSGATC